MKIADVFRYPRKKYPVRRYVDGYPNYCYVVAMEGATLPLLEKGINPVAPVEAADGVRRPAVLISSSPHKSGSRETPWEDVFDPDHGHIRYFGDGKRPEEDPSTVPGNQELLTCFDFHSSSEPSVRATAPPLLFFRRRKKGYVVFQGFGIVRRAERVTQFNARRNEYFSNYVFDFLVFDMSPENEVLDWGWINARRNPDLTVREALRKAPRSWQTWVRSGNASFDRIRRSVVKTRTVPRTVQVPPPESRAARVVSEVYAFYSRSGRRRRFEWLASLVVASHLRRSGVEYKEGWVTPPSSDGGTDFVGRIDLGTGFAKTHLVLLGQAKCEKPDSATGGNHVARTVARLRRGWVGAYVTTSYYSESVQREILNDKYPVLKLNGYDVAREVIYLARQGGYSSTNEFLMAVDRQYDGAVSERRPEELLLL